MKLQSGILAGSILVCCTFGQGSFLSAPDGSPSRSLTVDQDGRVGVGTEVPSNWFTIQYPAAGPHFVVKAAEWAGNLFELKERNGAGQIVMRNANGFQIAALGTDQADRFGRVSVSTANGYVTAEIAAVGPSYFTGGHIGIGTNTPAVRLHVRADTPEVARFETASGGSSYLALSHTGGGRDWIIESLRGGGFNIGDATAGRDRLTISTAGNVGIGTTSPQALLDVAGQLNCQVLQLTSDRNAKTAFASVDPRDVLAKLAAMPIQTWSYTNSPGIRHMGPMAQDFHAAFGVGNDERHIASVDADGIAFAAIQGLHQMVTEKNQEISALRKELEQLRDELTGRLVELERGLTETISASN